MRETVERSVVDYAGGFEELHSGLRETFRTRLLSEARPGSVALDVGCGSGRVTFFLSSHVGRVIGVDRDAKAIEAAREKAKRVGIGNVEFVVDDVERTSYAKWHPGGFDLAATNLCLSDRVIHRAGEALPAGRALVFASFGPEQWKELGGSRHALDLGRIRAIGSRPPWKLESLHHEVRELRFRSVGEAKEAAGPDLFEAWQKDGRWDRLVANFASGNRVLTESRLIGVLRR